MRTLRLKGKDLIKFGAGARNIHDLSLRSKRSYPVIRDYITYGGSKKGSVDLSVLASILMDGLELKESEILEMKIGDLFEFLDIEDSAA